MVSLKQLSERFLKLKGRTLITFHSIGDLDAVASAIVLSSAIPGSEVRMIDGLNAQSKIFLSRLGLKILPIEHLNYDSIILVDVSNVDLLGDFREAFLSFEKPIFAIDHHYHTKLVHGLVYVNKDRADCCEIIAELLKKMGKRIEREEAILLSAGILSDTALFKSANNASFRSFSWLLGRSKLKYSDLLQLISVPQNRSERIARLRALQRATFYEIGGFIAATSESGSFELSCASALIEAGCDFAFVANPHEGRISGLKSESIPFGNIGLIMEQVGKMLSGSGGGHSIVGGARGQPYKTGPALRECIRLLEVSAEEFEKKQLNVSEF